MKSYPLETKKREEAPSRRHSDEQYRMMIEETKDYAIFILDPNGRIKTWNIGAERIKGYTVDEIVGKHFSVFYTPEDIEVQMPKRLLAQALAEGRVEVEGWRVRKDGSRFWANVVLTAFFDRKGEHTGFGKITRDLTEKRRAQESIHQQEMELAQIRKLEAIGQLAGGVAHDFNNLLTGIMGITNDLMSTFPAGDARMQDLELILDSAQKAFDVTKQLLAFGRRQITQPKVLIVNDVIRPFSKLVERLIGEKIKMSFKLGVVPPVKIDPGQLEQIVLNLIVNARDAMSQGGIIDLRTYSVTLSAGREGILRTAPGDYVVLEVQDKGCGMNEDTLAHIFEPFFTTKGKDKGTGLGLATVFGIVKQAGGDIDVTSAPGKGSVFRVFLPVSLEPVSKNVTLSRSTPLNTSASVLVIDDQPIVRRVARRHLERLGYRAIEAADKDQALRIVREDDRIGVVLTDVIMPDTNGKELVKAIRQLRPDMRVVFMSGYPDDVIAGNGVLEAGARYLEKSRFSDDLGKIITEALNDGLPGSLSTTPPERNPI